MEGGGGTKIYLYRLATSCPLNTLLFAFLTCAQRTRVYYCPQHWLLCHLSFVLVRGRVPQAVTKKTAGFPGFDPLSISPVRCLFPRTDVLTLYSIESTTIALVLDTYLLLCNAVLYGCMVQRHCSTAVRRTEVQYTGRQYVRTVNYVKYVTARNLIGPC